MCWHCWGPKARNSVEGESTQPRRSRRNPISTPSLRASSPYVSKSRVPVTPTPALRVPALSQVSIAPTPNEQPFGLRVLAHGTDPVLDLVAVHGLDGHREGTWTAENRVLWLRDYLPEVVPNVRVLAYGYDGRTHGSTPLSCQTLHDHAISLITDLILDRQGTNVNERPIIFVAHSIGGIIVKDALIHSSSANRSNLEHHNAIKTSTYGILFFGTPHQGTDNLTWKRIFLNAASLFTNTNSAIIRDLEDGSGWLQKQLGQYTHISTDFETIFFYETYPPSSGGSIIVPKDSAVVPGATDTEVFAINSDHEGLVKYRSTDDRGFKVASSCIRSMVEKAPSIVTENWQRWRRIKGNLTHAKRYARSYPYLVVEQLTRLAKLSWGTSGIIGADRTFNIAAEINKMQITFDIPFEMESRRNPRFTGREYLLKTLHNDIKGSKSTSKLVVLYGTGGIGKTDVALEYVYAHRKEYSSIFWINAATRATTLAGFRAVAQRLIKQHAKIAHNSKPNYRLIAQNLDMVDAVDENGRISHEEEHSARMVQGVKLWFTNEENQGWLLVFDNIDDLDSFKVESFVPSASHGAIIMTSRRPECSAFGKGLEVKEMLEQEGIVLLLKSARIETDPADLEDYSVAAEVAKKLGYMPLGLIQAGAYVAARKISFKKYLGIYETFFDKVFGEKPPSAVWSYGDRTALTTWEISFQAIKDENKEAAELLSMCSFLSHENIREDMLYRGKKLGEDDTTLDDSMILLFSYSLAQRKESYDNFYIHPLVHVWARERLEEHERVQKAKEAVIIVGNAVEYSSQEKVDYWEYGNEVMVHIDLIGTNIKKYLKAELTDAILIEGVGRVAEVNSKLGRFTEAEGLQLLVVEASQSVLGKEHADTLRAMRNLASTYWDQSQLKKAEELQLQTMKASQMVQGKDHQDTLTVMSNLAGTYWDQGRQSEAEALGLQVVEARQRCLGEEHPDTLMAISNLAKIYRNQGRWKEAEKMLLQVVRTRQKVLHGNDHPETMEAMAALALVYHSQGRLKEAEKLQLQVVEASQRVLGKEHSDTMTETSNLASTFREQGRLKEAEVLELQVLEASRRLLGDEHSKTMISVSNLAKTYRDQGRLKEAEEMQLQVMEMMRRVLGIEHPDTLVAIANLASTYNDQERFDEAEKLGLQALGEREKVLGKNHPDTLISMANLAYTYYNQERLKEAGELELQVLEVSSEVLGKEHPDTISAMVSLASTYNSQERLNEAEELELQVLKLRECLLGKNHPDTISAMVSLASTYYNQERLNEAEELELQVLKLRECLLGKEHPDTISAMVSLASTYNSQERLNEAEELELQVLKLRECLLGKEHPDTLGAMGNLALIYRKQGRLDEAVELGLQVVEAMKRVLGEEHPNTMTAMINLGVTYWYQGRPEESEKLELQVVSVRQREVGEDHPDTLTAMANLAMTYYDQGRLREAGELELQVSESRQRVLGKGHPDTITTMANLASIYRDQERLKEAEVLEIQIAEARQSVLGQDHLNYDINGQPDEGSISPKDAGVLRKLSARSATGSIGDQNSLAKH